MRVHVKYDVLNKNANDYIDYSNELDNIMDNFNRIGQSIDEHWDSSNKTLYINSLNECVRRTRIDSTYMKRYGNALLGIKDDFKNKDEEYRQQFNNDVVEVEKI